MPDGNQEMAQDIFLAMLAAARGDDQAAGDILRRATARMSGQMFRVPPGAAVEKPGAPPGKASLPDLGEPEEEV